MSYDAPAAYLPHTEPMVLLERVLTIDERSACCEVSITQHGRLSRYLDHEQNLPAWYTIELLAQTVGVWFGWHQQKNQCQHPEIGLLLGGRAIKSQLPVFPLGATLSVHIALQLKDGNIGSFDGEIKIEGNRVAQGRLTTYQPKSDELNRLFQRIKS